MDLASTSNIPGKAPKDPKKTFSRLVVIRSLLAIEVGVSTVERVEQLLPDLCSQKLTSS
jgi:hypothetical protein